MREFIEFTQEEKQAYEIGLLIREYGEKTNQPTWAFADSFYTRTTSMEKGNPVDIIRFKKHSFRDLLNVNPPDDIISKKDDKLFIAFTIGMMGGKDKWNVEGITQESLTIFFEDRPKVSPSSISEQAGFSAKYLRMILTGDRTLTESAIKKIRPILHLHGWGRKK